MFITFEGVEGAGKTTQIGLLSARLREEMGQEHVLVTREPGDGPLGSELRRLVLHPPPGVIVTDRAELLIMLADRAQHVAQVIRPALRTGGVVLCDRYADSSVAYQGYGRGLDIEVIDRLNRYATDNLQPDLTFVLDMDPALGLERQNEKSRMEEESLAFHQRVRAGFLALAARYPDRITVIESARTKEIVHTDILSRVKARLSTP